MTACLACVIITFTACNNAADNKTTAATARTDSPAKGSYAYDAAFLKAHTHQAIELQDEEGKAKVLLSADYQGRVMTSTALGDSGTSFGWINYALVESPQRKKQFNPVGGEERFWMGPEGGQYSIYFKGGDSFNIAHWQVPAIIDTINYDVVQTNKSTAVFTKKTSFVNYSGTAFDLAIERTISLLNAKQAEDKLHISIPSGVHVVGYETVNHIQNTGTTDWSEDKGLLSIWLLGMFTPSAKTTVIIPFSWKPHGHDLSDAAAMNNPPAYHLITDNYFGVIPADRLTKKDSVLFFTCDGKYRSKIGLSPRIAKSIAGSFDAEKNILTILIPQVDKTAEYVNSKWEIQKEPYKGDVINSYNDGPLADGTQMGPFYEIESSSPALQLKKGQTGEYRQSTFHLQGDYNALNEIAKKLLGVNLDELKK